MSVTIELTKDQVNEFLKDNNKPIILDVSQKEHILNEMKKRMEEKRKNIVIDRIMKRCYVIVSERHNYVKNILDKYTDLHLELFHENIVNINKILTSTDSTNASELVTTKAQLHELDNFEKYIKSISVLCPTLCRVIVLLNDFKKYLEGYLITKGVGKLSFKVFNDRKKIFGSVFERLDSTALITKKFKEILSEDEFKNYTEKN